MTRKTLFTAALALFPNVALAKNVELARPILGASLDAGGIDMVVYYIDRDDHFELVATYARKETPMIAEAIRLSLRDGDAVGFRLSGEQVVTYKFIRNGTSIEARATVKKARATKITFIRSNILTRMTKTLTGILFGPAWGEPSFESNSL